MGKQTGRIPQEEFKKLSEYPWPRNVRELKHFIERAVILSDVLQISLSGLDHGSAHREPIEQAGLLPWVDMERDYLKKVLNATYWKVSGRNGAAALFFRRKNSVCGNDPISKFD